MLRKTWLALLSGILLCTVGSASAEIRMTASLQGPIETSYGKAFQQFDACVKEKSGGELTLQIYPNSQLGSLSEAFEQVRQGVVDVTAAAPGTMAEFYPQVQVLSVPFLFKDRGHWERVLAGPVGERIANEALEKAGVRVLGYFGGSVRQIISIKPIKSVGDFKGSVLRLLPSDVLHTAWRAVGAAPTVVTLNEIYNALSLGVVQSVDMEPEWTYRMKFYEHAKNMTMTSHEIVTRLLLFSNKRYTSLPEASQKIISECGRSASAFERDMESKLDDEMIEVLRTKHGVVLLPIDRDQLQQTVSGALERQLKKLGLDGYVADIKSAQ